METLISERIRLMQEIIEELTPRINGEIPCSIEEKEACIAKRVQSSNRVTEIEAELKLKEQEQKVADVDSMELPFDFDTDFGVEGVNQIVRQMLKEERANNFVAFNAEYDRLKAENDEELAGYAERELQLQRQNDELQREVTMRVNLIIDLTNDKEKAEKDYYELEERMKEVEQNRKNATDQLEEAHAEIERLERLVDEQRIQNAFGERGMQRTIDVTPTVNDLYEQAKAATAEKRKVMVTAEIGLYREVEDENGTKEMVHHTELAGMEQVESFLELPDIAGVDYNVSEDENSTEMAGSDLVLDSGEGTEYRNAGAIETEADPTAQETDQTPSEETWEQSIERRIAVLIYRTGGQITNDEIHTSAYLRTA